MSTSFIDTNAIAPVALNDGQGRYAEILNDALCGARSVVGSLRWLESGQSLAARSDATTHQVVYLMEGQGVIHLDGKDYEVGTGAGIYLGPSEAASISQKGGSPLKLFHLVVPSPAS